MCAIRAQTDPCDPPLWAVDAVDRINAVRIDGAGCASAGGLEPLSARPVPVRWNAQLAGAARRQAIEMAAARRIGHRDRDDRALGLRLAMAGYPTGLAVENVGFGYVSVDAVVAAWRASPAHCRNLMQQGVVDLGIGCADRDDERYWALMLGAPAVPARAVPAADMPARATITAGSQPR